MLRKAARAKPEELLEKLTVADRGGTWRRFADRPPVLFRVSPAVAGGVLRSLPAYRETLGPARQIVFDGYRPADVAFKIVGTGSVGTRDYVVLACGRGKHDPLFLQVKQEGASAYAPYRPASERAAHEGRRVAIGQLRMQTVSDPLLGWATIRRLPYLVRQLADHKASIDPGDLKGRALVEYATVSGEIFAKGHARTGPAAVLAGYCGRTDKLDRALASFAIAYADQATADFECFKRFVRRGRMSVRRGV